MMFKNPICFGMRFLSVWIVSNHAFKLIFSSLEFTKSMVGDRRPNTCKIVPIDRV
jgi:hypothetical protein